jgi:FixJ family two-component response regulator
MKEGARDFIVKPFQAEKVASTLHKVYCEGNP